MSHREMSLAIEIFSSTSESFTVRKMSKYGGFSGPYFPVFGPAKTPYLDTFYAVIKVLK